MHSGGVVPQKTSSPAHTRRDLRPSETRTLSRRGRVMPTTTEHNLPGRTRMASGRADGRWRVEAPRTQGAHKIMTARGTVQCKLSSVHCMSRLRTFSLY